MKKILMIMMAAAIIFAGYSKDDGNDDDNGKGNGDVYVAGRENSGYGYNELRYIKVWKNDKALYTLTNGTTMTSVKSIFVSGNDVYVAGTEYDVSTYNPEDNPVVKVWKNSQLLYTLTDGTNSGYATSIFVLGNDVYVAGCEGHDAKVWKNGEILYTFTGVSSPCMYVK